MVGVNHAHGRKRRCGCGVVKSSLRSWSSGLAAKPANKKFSVRARPLKTSRLRIWAFLGKMFSLFLLLYFFFSCFSSCKCVARVL